MYFPPRSIPVSSASPVSYTGGVTPTPKSPTGYPVLPATSAMEQKPQLPPLSPRSSPAYNQISPTPSADPTDSSWPNNIRARDRAPTSVNSPKSTPHTTTEQQQLLRMQHLQKLHQQLLLQLQQNQQEQTQLVRCLLHQPLQPQQQSQEHHGPLQSRQLPQQQQQPEIATGLTKASLAKMRHTYGKIAKHPTGKFLLQTMINAAVGDVVGNLVTDFASKGMNSIDRAETDIGATNSADINGSGINMWDAGFDGIDVNGISTDYADINDTDITGINNNAGANIGDLDTSADAEYPDTSSLDSTDLAVDPDLQLALKLSMEDCNVTDISIVPGIQDFSSDLSAKGSQTDNSGQTFGFGGQNPNTSTAVTEQMNQELFNATLGSGANPALLPIG